MHVFLFIAGHIFFYCPKIVIITYLKPLKLAVLFFDFLQLSLHIVSLIFLHTAIKASSIYKEVRSINHDIGLVV